MEKIRIIGSRSRLRKCDSLISETRLDSSKVFAEEEQNWKERNLLYQKIVFGEICRATLKFQGGLPRKIWPKSAIVSPDDVLAASSVYRLAPTFPKSSRPERFSRSNVSRGLGSSRNRIFNFIRQRSGVTISTSIVSLGGWPARSMNFKQLRHEFLGHAAATATYLADISRGRIRKVRPDVAHNRAAS